MTALLLPILVIGAGLVLAAFIRSFRQHGSFREHGPSVALFERHFTAFGARRAERARRRATL